MIKAILIFNNHGKPRLSKFYQRYVRAGRGWARRAGEGGRAPEAAGVSSGPAVRCEVAGEGVGRRGAAAGPVLPRRLLCSGLGSGRWRVLRPCKSRQRGKWDFGENRFPSRVCFHWKVSFSRAEGEGGGVSFNSRGASLSCFVEALLRALPCFFSLALGVSDGVLPVSVLERSWSWEDESCGTHRFNK